MGDIPSSNGFPSLATVVDRFLTIFGKNLDCLGGFDSDLGVVNPSLFNVLLLPVLLMRKKFLSFVDTWVFDVSSCDFCFLVPSDNPEKLRFSVAIMDVFMGGRIRIEGVEKEGDAALGASDWLKVS